MFLAKFPPRWSVWRTTLSPRLLGGLVAALWLGLVPGAAWGQAAGSRDGLFFSVPNPITDAFVKHVEQTVNKADKDRKLSVVVFDFNPSGNPSGTKNYGSCRDLANYILRLNARVQTMAFVSNEVTQHTVLPVLACQQRVMSEARDEKTRQIKAKIGDVCRGLEHRLDDDVVKYYEMLAKKNSLGDLVARMISKDVRLNKVKTADGTTLYLSDESIARLPDKSFVREPLPDALTPGKTLFEAPLAREVNLCQASADSRAQLAAKLDLPRKVLTDDWLGGRSPLVWRVEFRGETNKGSMDSLERRIKAALGRGANFIILQLEGSGGETTHVASTAEFISGLRDPNDSLPIKTVAYIPPGASLGAATFLALGCSEIVMADNAYLADFSYLRESKEAELKTRRDMLVPLAKQQGYPWKLFDASLDPTLVLYWARPKNVPKGASGREQLLTREEFLRDAKEWDKLDQVTHEGDFLKIDANLARRSGLAQVLTGATLEGLYALYGLDIAKVQVARDHWLDHVAEFFRQPLVRFFLVMLGIIGLILELKMPGTAVPGVLAAICFVLFFWSYSFIGEFTMLAVLLFVLGVILLGVEIFVLPGFGFTGIAGVILIIISLALVTLEKWPSSAQEWYELGTTLVTFGMSLVTAVASAMVIAWFLPSIPYVNRLVLSPPGEEAEPFESAPQVSLLGAIGLAQTPLRPAGKAQFGDEFHDVIAEGDFVNPGQRVQVIEIEGNRIVVKEI